MATPTQTWPRDAAQHRDIAAQDLMEAIRLHRRVMADGKVTPDEWRLEGIVGMDIDDALLQLVHCQAKVEPQ